MRKRLLWLYILFLHILIIAVLIKPDMIPRIRTRLGFAKKTKKEKPELSPVFDDMVSYQIKLDKNVPDGSVLFIGDSITYALYVDAVSENAVNFSIPGDTTTGVLKRLNKYTSLSRAKTVILSIGVNDIPRRDNAETIAQYQKILNMIPEHVPVICSGALPVDMKKMKWHPNDKIRDLNKRLKKLVASRKNSVFVDSFDKLLDADGQIDFRYHIGDGIHLTYPAYNIWIADLKEALEKIETKD